MVPGIEVVQVYGSILRLSGEPMHLIASQWPTRLNRHPKRLILKPGHQLALAVRDHPDRAQQVNAVEVGLRNNLPTREWYSF